MGFTIFQVAFMGVIPVGLVYITKKQKALKFMGPILLAYVVGILMANIPFSPWDRSLSMSVSEIAVPIAIPLVLMSTNLLKWIKLAKKTVFSFIMVMVAAMLSSIISVVIFRNTIDVSWKLSGMLTGCYTGGTPNLIAVGMSLGVPSKTIVMINSCDMLIGGIYFILITSVLKKVYRRFLPEFSRNGSESGEIDPFMQGIFSNGRKKGFKNIGITVGLAIMATAITVGSVLLVTGEMAMIPILLIVSTFGIGFSFSKKLHKIEGTWHIAQYVILLFSVGLGGTVDLKGFFRSSPTLLLYTATIMIFAIVIHFILCKMFKIDSDTAMITSVAGVFGPAFIAPVANAIDNQDVVVSGLITGLAGYAVGNYLGLAVAFLAKIVI